MHARRQTNIMNILAIETSCDETAIAVIDTARDERGFRVLSNIVLSQIPLHAKWGGVVPNIAKREHEKALAPLLLQALDETNKQVSSIKYQVSRAHKKNLNTLYLILDPLLEKNEELLKQFKEHIAPLQKPKIDIIAVTQGPGLEPALWVGVNFARALSALWNIPLIGINHMEGHIASALLKQSRKISNFQKTISKQIPKSKSKISKNNATSYKLISISYPAIALLVSGGHTELVLIKKPLKYEIIGETRDDAAGEAFDKVARLLDLPYPGGPSISAEAEQSEVGLPKIVGSPTSDCLFLPRPMMHTKDFDFSFSGLKTAALYLVRDLKKQRKSIKKLRPAICKEFQDAVVEVLVAKTMRAVTQYKAKTVLLGGGVAANTHLQKKLGEAIKINSLDTLYFIPDARLTGDNALMIAVAAIARAKQAKKTAWKTLEPDANMRF